MSPPYLVRATDRGLAKHAKPSTQVVHTLLWTQSWTLTFRFRGLIPDRNTWFTRLSLSTDKKITLYPSIKAIKRLTTPIGVATSEP